MLEKTILSAAMMFEHHKIRLPALQSSGDSKHRDEFYNLKGEYLWMPIRSGSIKSPWAPLKMQKYLEKQGQWTPWSPCCLHPSGLWTHQILVRTCNHWMIISTSSHQQLIQHAIHCCVFGSSAKDSGSPERCSFSVDRVLSVLPVQEQSNKVIHAALA